MELILIIVLGFLALLGAVISRLVTDEVKAWIPWIIDRAVSMLPKDRRERFAEEWSSHVDEIPGDIGKLAAALGFIVASSVVAGTPVTTRKRIFDIAAGVAALSVLLLSIGVQT